jgi:hypothetical protein
MAKQNVGIDIPCKANADLSSYQYYFVEQSTTNDEVGVANATTDKVLGVLQDKPAGDGYECSVRILGHSKVIAGETLTAGSLLGPTAVGSATALTAGTSTTAYIVGICTSGADSGEVAEMVVLHGPARAQ